LKHAPWKPHQFLDLGFPDFLVMKSFLLEGFSQLGHEIFQLDGFQKVIEGPSFHAFDAGFYRSVPRQ
jgi:hypothetical protein